LSKETADSSDLGELLLPIFPKILFAANSILESCTSAIDLPKKDGVVLWIIATQPPDDRGPFAETALIILEYQRWFAATADTASTQVSRSGKALLAADLVEVARRRNRLYLTVKGRQLAATMFEQAKRELGTAFASLSSEQYDVLPKYVELVSNAVTPPDRKPASSQLTFEGVAIHDEREAV